MSDDNKEEYSGTVFAEAWENSDEIDLSDPKVMQAVKVLAREAQERKEKGFRYRMKQVFSKNLPNDVYGGFKYVVIALGSAAIAAITIWSKS